MNRVYADPLHAVESVEEHIEFSDEDSGTVTILDTECVVEAETREALEERNITSALDMIDATICSIEWEENTFGGVMLELHFHESSVEETFELTPAGVEAIGANQATDPTDLSDRLGRALSGFEERDAIWTFAGVDAGSMASGGHYTDFEFEYSIDGISF